VARSIVGWFDNAKNKELVSRLLKQIKISNPKRQRKKQTLAGLNVVLTGELVSLTRDQAKQAVREHGGDVSASVSKETDLVVAGSEPGSKFDKAKALGVKIIEEEEFLKMIK